MNLPIIIQLVASIALIASANLTRSGRCPNAQYAFSGLSCSAEGDDSPCPDEYKCCPLTNGMRCFKSCPEFAKPCTIQCPFGFKVYSRPCTICECADNPCLSTLCPLGTKCIPKEHEPCAISGRCGITAQCIEDSSLRLDSAPKPNNCPEYWPPRVSNLRSCHGPDSLCPGAEKCCQARSSDSELSNGLGSYCVQPCKDISDCNLRCPWGFVVKSRCRLCQCVPDPCEGILCGPGESCHAFPIPCVFEQGRMPCPLLTVCI